MNNSSNTNNYIDTLYREYINDLFSYAIHLGFDKETCQDAIHDVFYKLCINHIKPDKIKNPRFYLLRALKNRLLDIHKQKKEHIEFSPHDTSEELPFAIHVTIEDKLIQTEEDERLQELVRNMLQMLSDRQREIIYLRYSQGCDYEEIAQLMNISVNSCRKLSHKAITKLKMASPHLLSSSFFIALQYCFQSLA